MRYLGQAEQLRRFIFGVLLLAFAFLVHSRGWLDHKSFFRFVMAAVVIAVAFGLYHLLYNKERHPIFKLASAALGAGIALACVHYHKLGTVIGLSVVIIVGVALFLLATMSNKSWAQLYYAETKPRGEIRNDHELPTPLYDRDPSYDEFDDESEDFEEPAEEGLVRVIR